MPTPAYEKSFYLEKSVEVSAESTAFLLDALAKLNLNLTLRNGTFDLGGGESHKFSGIDDYKSFSDDMFSKCTSLILWVKSDKIESCAFFKKAQVRGDHRLPSSFSYVNVWSEDQVDQVFIKGVVDLFVSRYAVSGSPREGMFIALGNDEVTGYESKSGAIDVLTSGSDVHLTFWQRLRGPWKLGGAVTLLTLLIGYLGVRNGNRQTATGESQLNLEREAQFTVQRLASSENPNNWKLKDWRLTNLGRATATEVSVYCGSPAEHSPKGDLGTIGPNLARDFHFSIDADEHNLNHQQDILCNDSFYIVYKDGVGSHSITFDSAGNAKAAN